MATLMFPTAENGSPPRPAFSLQYRPATASTPTSSSSSAVRDTDMGDRTIFHSRCLDSYIEEPRTDVDNSEGQDGEE